MKPSFGKNCSLDDFQKMIQQITGPSNDQLFSVIDLANEHSIFVAKALKGLRLSNHDILKSNLIIAFCWLNTIANRLNVNIEQALWRKYPYICPYCGQIPCTCKAVVGDRKVRPQRLERRKPKNFADFQKMFELIYPSKNRTLMKAGMHMAEESGEINEAIYDYLKIRKDSYIHTVEDEIADWASHLFTVSNSAGIDIGQELDLIFKDHFYSKDNAFHKFFMLMNI